MRDLLKAMALKLRVRFVVPLGQSSAYEEEGKWFGGVRAWSVESARRENERKKMATTRKKAAA